MYPTLELVRDIAQIINYVALSISGPLAVIAFLRAKKSERLEREYRIYDELDNKLLEFHKLALEHDLDLLDLPDYHPFLVNDRPRKKNELVASGVGFALFQRAFLMFRDQPDRFRARQWRGWEDLLDRFLTRLPVRDAWQITRGRFDTVFQEYVDNRLVKSMEADGTDPAVVSAFRRTGLFIRDETEHTFDGPTVQTWQAALEAFRQGQRAA